MSGRIATLKLKESANVHRSPEAEHERNVAMADLRGENLFEPAGMPIGAYDVTLKVEEDRLVFDIDLPETKEHAKVAISVRPLKSIIRDYFLICESYYDALKAQSPSKLEAIDMGRRGVHNEGSELLKEMLEGKITVDFPTARRLFTLICVLHIK